MIFGKLYLLGVGTMLLIIGTALSFTGSTASTACAKIESLPQGISIPFNPCTIFSKLPTAGLALQIIGIAIIAITIFLLIKEAKKRPIACPKCNALLPKNSVYCNKCGTGLAQEKEKK